MAEQEENDTMNSSLADADVAAEASATVRLTVDEALMKLGTIGRWQVIHYTLISTACMVPTCLHMLAIIYIGAWPMHHCEIPEGALFNETIPATEDFMFNACHMYVDGDVNKTVPCEAYHYEYGDIGPTITSKWDLVCGRSYLMVLTQTILIAGYMFGALFFTMLADKFGRKPVFLFSNWAMVVIGVITAFLPDYTAFVFFRFLAGTLIQGMIVPSFVMACELFAAKHRTFAGTIIEVFWAVAVCLYALLAFLVQNWVHLQLIISLFGLLTIPLYWIVPESVVWLCANDRVAEAEEVIRKAAKLNNITLPDKMRIYTDATVDGGDADRASDGGTIGETWLDKFRNLRNFMKSEKSKHSEARYTILDIIRNRHLVVHVLCMAYLWMAITFVFYGLVLTMGQLAGNMYVNNFIGGFVEIPAYISSYFAMQKLGRRRSLIVYYAATGISLILSSVIPEQSGGVSLVPAKITFSMIGKFGISGAAAVVCLYTPEIFPTTLRSLSLGIVNFTGGIGNLVAPFTPLMAIHLPWVPGLLFGGLSIVGTFLTLLLPETLNRPLPQTIEEINEWYSGKPAADTDNKREMHPMNREQLDDDTVA